MPSPPADVTRTVSVTRTVGSDPSSTALLLAGPGALDFWPGLHRIDDTEVTSTEVRAAGRLGGSTRVRIVVQARAPRRTPISIVADLDVEAEGQDTVTGRLSLISIRGREPDAGAATRARIELFPTGRLASEVRTELTRAADDFLDNLARAAETAA